jgi:glyoxylase-like metal-dependent hydrolase (beta-lactamase superfamily II)
MPQRPSTGLARLAPRFSAALTRGLVRACALIAAVALQGARASPPASGSAPAAEQVAPGVYVVRGSGGEVGPDNRGRIGNAGFIVGESGVLAIDSGVSRRHGSELLAAIRQVTALPVRRLVLTHVRQEFVFGASAFQDAGIPVTMHVSAARLMASRCEGCLKTLQRVVGSDEMAGSRVIRPDDPFDPSVPTFAPFGASIGRAVRLLAFGPADHSSGPGDLAVLDETTGTLFAGGLLDADSIPDVQDADFSGWRQALAALREMPLKRIVPGHGPVSSPPLIMTNLRYLDQLEARTAALLQAGTPLSDVADETRLPDYATWDQYDTIHRRNASIVFLRQERAMMLRQP